MSRHLCWATSLAVVAAMGVNTGEAQLIHPNSATQAVLLDENFDGLIGSLGPSVNERLGFPLVTAAATGPDSEAIAGFWSGMASGWTVDKDLSTYDGSPTLTTGIPGVGVADYGVDEWEGWNFADKDFWVEAAGDQDRSQFGSSTAASGVVAIADPDEYFDLGGPDNAANGGYYSTALVSPSIPVVGGQVYGLGFDSSWRPEAFDDSTPMLTDLNNQSVEIIASFDMGDDVQVTKWNSDPGDPFFKDDAADENFAADGSGLAFSAPGGATSMTLSFNLANAGNDWWWAIDNVQVNDLTGAGATVFSEDFEGVALGDSINERRSTLPNRVTAHETTPNTEPYPDAFTHDGSPIGVMTVNNNVGGVGDPDNGVEEWEGWSFTTPDFWTFADLQGRESFSKGTGVIAVADPDEWDDLGNPDENPDGSPNFFDASLDLPTLDINGVEEGRLALFFDSSWRPEDSQTAQITVDYGNGPIEVLRWTSDDSDPFFHDGNTDESIGLLLNNPAGAATADISFRIFDAGNDWWWALDNVRVAVVPEPSSVVLVGLAVCCGLGLGIRRRNG